MCEVQGNSSTAKPNVTFEQVVEQIENLEEPFRKGEKTLRDIEQMFFEACSIPNFSYERLKTYLECKVMENNTDMKKWIADFLMSVTKIILPVLVGATALKSDNLNLCEILCLLVVETAISMLFVGIICIFLGFGIELPMKIQHNKKCLYEICLKLLEQYLPPKNQINN